MVLELTWKHFSCSEQYSWQYIGIWPRIHFSGQGLMQQLRSTICMRTLGRSNKTDPLEEDKKDISLYNPLDSSALAEARPPPPAQVTLPHRSTEQVPSNATSTKQTKVSAK